MNKFKRPETNQHIMSPEICPNLDGSPCIYWEYSREGEVIYWHIHEEAMDAMQKRIDHLENCCDEYLSQFTGD